MNMDNLAFENKVDAPADHTDYHFFWGGPLSNFSPLSKQMRHGCKNFRTSEQAFMYEKALCFGDKATARQILDVPTPKDAKRLGRKVAGFDDAVWKQRRYDAMHDVCMNKFTQSESHKQALLDTGDAHLVEASPYDRVWGVGLSADDPAIQDERNWRGDNLLGKVLMEVRDKIKKIEGVG